MGGSLELKSRRTGFVLGLILFLFIMLLPVPQTFIEMAAGSLKMPSGSPEVLEAAFGTQTVLATLAIMVCWWITEALPIPVTALLPGIIFPLFHVTGVFGGKIFNFDAKNTLLNYANPVIFLFLGGFLIAAALHKWNLDRRLTLYILTRGNLANKPKLVVLGIMSVSAFISMWISNTATAAMFLPLGLGILGLMGLEAGKSNMGKALMLGIAWSASIGGIGTVIGTPPNGICLSVLSASGYAKIGFVDWMKIGIPTVLIMTPLAWFMLMKIFPPELKTIKGGKELLMKFKAELGPITKEEKIIAGVFLLAVFLWISSPFWPYIFPAWLSERLSWFDEYEIALFAAFLLFIIPSDIKTHSFILDWTDTKSVEWGVLLLFGGGIALSDAMFRTGLAGYIASAFMGFAGTPSTLMMLVFLVIMIDFLSEVTSNTAVSSMMIPIVISIARNMGNDVVALAVGATLAASLGFMLPVATPPNAIVYGSGYLKVKDMIKAGFMLDIAGWLVVLLVLYVFAYQVFGVIRM
ncbi:MAG: DASS family sodium-coupled anion symporter [Ignavibacteria bacterium]|jgi:sodium-dependent dicarboxylate transporter 2/3/5|nr:DASS family sodium-coupled anion symporter [Ignavibacteria bacterium]MCU7504643.1 DASS family sodium-coupled anion symporter [Ignavibacteria bacterium]MCU7517549.1 DASS family sodium-coupled anion symporter [Ignavibacteria bacterium]